VASRERLGFTAAQLQAAERPLIEAGVPLMARAAAGLAAEIRRRLAERGAGGGRILLLVGSGDNGADALFAGAELAEDGFEVTAVPTGSRMHEAGTAAALAAGVRILAPEEADARLEELVRGAEAIVDGILGIGAAASPALRGRARELVARIRPLLERESRPLVIAVDLPSGVGADDGSVPDPTAVLPADVTVTFGAEKAGLLLSPGAEVAGEVVLVDIGLGPALAGVEPAMRQVSDS